MFSKQTQELINNAIGYRNNNVGDYKSYPALSVLKFECKDLENEDILDTLYDQGLIEKPTYREAVNFIKEMQEVRGQTLYAFWLCASEEDVKNNYPDEYGYENKDNVITVIDVYSIPDWFVVMSDLGDQGTLFLSDTTLGQNYIETIEYGESL